MPTATITATYREGDHYIVEAEVDCLQFRYKFTDPDCERELLWMMLDDEKYGLHLVARYEILDHAQKAIDSGILDNHPGVDWTPYFQAAEAVSDCDCCSCGEAEVSFTIDEPSDPIAELRSDMRTLYRRVGWILVGIGVVACSRLIWFGGVMIGRWWGVV